MKKFDGYQPLVLGPDKEDFSKPITENVSTEGYGYSETLARATGNELGTAEAREPAPTFAEAQKTGRERLDTAKFKIGNALGGTWNRLKGLGAKTVELGLTGAAAIAALPEHAGALGGAIAHAWERTKATAAAWRERKAAQMNEIGTNTAEAIGAVKDAIANRTKETWEGATKKLSDGWNGLSSFSAELAAWFEEAMNRIRDERERKKNERAEAHINEMIAYHDSEANRHTQEATRLRAELKKRQEKRGLRNRVSDLALSAA